MNSKKFEYAHKDIPFLKKNITIRTIFCVFFLVIFAWQLLSIYLAGDFSNLTIVQIFSSSFTLLITLLMSFISLMYVFKYFRIISAVKKHGKCISSVQVMFNIKKSGFIKLYKLLTEGLTLLAVVILVCVATYSILSLTYYATVSFYLPFLITLCLSSFNSVFHIDEEVKIIETVNQFNAIY